MENFEQLIAFQHVLLEVSKELLSATPDRIAGIVKQSFYEIGELVLANRIYVQLFNDLNDHGDDEVIAWSIMGEAVKSTPLSNSLIEFFYKDEPFISKGTVEKAFSDAPFLMDALVYPMLVHGQPIGFVFFELNQGEHLPQIKKMIRHTVDVYTRSFERRIRNRMIFDQASITEATLIAVDLCIIATDDSGKIEMINRHGEELLHINLAQTVGRYFDEVLEVINDTYEMPIESFIRDMIMSQDYMSIVDPISILVDGEKLPIMLKMSPKYDSDQLYQGAVIIIQKNSTN